MAYCIKRTWSNGYRCLCCYSTWEHEEWVDTLEEALEAVPTENTGRDNDPPEDQPVSVEMVAVEVRDGITDDKIAWGFLLFSSGFGRGSGYMYHVWRGYRPDTGNFETVYQRGVKTSKTWDEVRAELKTMKEQEDIQQETKRREDLLQAKQKNLLRLLG